MKTRIVFAAAMGLALLAFFTAPPVALAFANSVTYSGQGLIANGSGGYDLETELCGVANGAPVDGPYLLWVFTATRASNADITGPWGTATMTKSGNGAFKYISGWYDLSTLPGNVTATYDGSPKNAQLTIGQGCPPTACLAGLLLASGETIGYPPNNFTTRANNDVAYTFANSQPAANDYAIFQTHDPWGGTIVKTAISSVPHTFSVFTPAQLAGFTFSDYRVIVLNWDDHFTTDFEPFYSAAIPALEAYINGGGVVWLQGSIQGTTGTTFPHPFGGTSTWDLQSQNFVVDTAHPLVAGVPQLINGNFASHAHLTGFPVSAHVIIVTGGDATGLPTLYTFSPACP